MEERNINIDQLYRNRQEQLDQLPPSAWDAMDKKLGAEPPAGNTGSGGGGGAAASIPAQYHWLWYVVITASVALITWQVLKPKEKESHKQPTRELAIQSPVWQQAETQAADNESAESHMVNNGHVAEPVKAANKNTTDEEVDTAHAAGADRYDTPDDKTPDKLNNAGIKETGNNGRLPVSQTATVSGTKPANEITNNTNHEPPLQGKKLVKQQLTTATPRTPLYKKLEPKQQPALAKKKHQAVDYDHLIEDEADIPAQDVSAVADENRRGDQLTVPGKQEIEPLAMRVPEPLTGNTPQPQHAQRLSATHAQYTMGVPAGDNTPPEIFGPASALTESTTPALTKKKNKKGSDKKANKETEKAASVSSAPEPESKSAADVRSGKAEQEAKRKANEPAVQKSAEAQKDKKAGGQRAQDEKAVAPAGTTMHTTDNTPATLKNSDDVQWSFEYGFKAGYEMGFGADAINRLLAAPYLQYNFSERFSVGIQPGIRYGAATTVPTPGDAAYYHPTGTTYDSQLVFIGGAARWKYTFQHGYDSIVVSYEAGNGASMEFELPVTFRYQATNRIALTAGVNFIKGALPSLTERKQTYNGLILTDTALADPNVPIWGPPDTTGMFAHTARPYSEYTNFTGGMPPSDPLRIGYMLGVQYTRMRWLMELDMMQQVSGLSNITNAQIKKQYSQPYFRLLLGIRFGK